MKEVDCIACIATGLTLSMGAIGRDGMVHYVRWSARGYKGVFRLCDFNYVVWPNDEPRVNPHAVALDPEDVSAMESP